MSGPHIASFVTTVTLPPLRPDELLAALEAMLVENDRAPIRWAVTAVEGRDFTLEGARWIG